MNKTTRHLLLLLPFILMACSKKIISPIIATPPKPTLAIEQIDFEYFHGKARMVYQDNKKEQEAKANIRVRKDSVIWISFNLVGIQGARALINKDSITILSNLKNEYYVFDYKELSKRYNFEINYDVIQAALLGNLIIQRSDDDVIEQHSSGYLLKQQTNNIGIINYVNGASMKIERVDMKETTNNNTLTINYSNFQPVGTKIFPYNGTLSIFYKTLSGLLSTTIIFEYNKAEVGDRELKFPFNIPKRYERR
ncbi:MAG TPA: DUF4292 domain-containing protein [Cyclobacteriaceae bacterium]|nr:DUF4292 domain-containing protein [Cyclobacteriaceae bacterium]